MAVLRFIITIRNGDGRGIKNNSHHNHKRSWRKANGHPRTNSKVIIIIGLSVTNPGSHMDKEDTEVKVQDRVVIKEIIMDIEAVVRIEEGENIGTRVGGIEMMGPDTEKGVRVSETETEMVGRGIEEGVVREEIGAVMEEIGAGERGEEGDKVIEEGTMVVVVVDDMTTIGIERQTCPEFSMVDGGL